MHKKRELAKNTVIIFLGKVSTQFISFFLLPLYTRFLSASSYGTVDLITTVAFDPDLLTSSITASILEVSKKFFTGS